MNKANNTIILSFCIPSYNYNQYTYSLVKNILKYPNNDIEVIVTDNCSTDNTVELLNTIKDSRLKIFKNNKNLGATGNFRESLCRSSGKYSYTYIARDLVESNKIEKLVRFLKDVDYGYICNSLRNESRGEYLGRSALNMFAYKYWHPTGHIFKTELIKEVLAKTKYYNFINKSYCPHDFWIVECCLREKSFAYTDILKKEHGPDYFKNTKSKFDVNANSNENILWFGYEKEYQELKNKLDHLNQLDVNSMNRDYLFKKVFLYQLLSVTTTLRKRLRNNVMCEHYSINTRNVSISEMMSNGKKIYDYANKWLEEINGANLQTHMYIYMYKLIIMAYILRERIHFNFYKGD